MHSPGLSPRGGPSDNFEKYHVIIEAEGAEGLDVEPGTEVSFVFKRHGKVSFSHASEVWDDGIVYWDSKCSQVCTVIREPDGSWRPKHCSLQIQTISLDSSGEPMGLGRTVAQATVDLTPHCTHTRHEDPSDPQRLRIDLQPTGHLTVQISSLWLKDWRSMAGEGVGLGTEGEETLCSPDGSVLSVTPAPSTASLCPEESSLTLGGYYCGGDTSTAASSPEVGCTKQRRDDGGGGGDDNANGVVFDVQEPQEEDRSFTERQSTSTTKRMPLSPLSQQQLPEYRTPMQRPSSSNSGGSATNESNTNSTGGSEMASIELLQRRCRRLQQERDEARAESFAEASVAVQRGIEVDNLKRAKDMLLQRLENTERQLMMAMQYFEPSTTSSPDSPTVSDATTTNNTKPNNDNEDAGEDGSSSEKGKERQGGETEKQKKGMPAGMVYGDGEAVLHALVDAKVSLAEKEFEIMELQGQIRAKEAHIDALTQHLEAARLQAEARLAAASSSSLITNTTPKGLGSGLRSVWHTPSITPPWSSHNNSPTKRNGGNASAALGTTPTADVAAAAGWPANGSKQSSTRASPLGDAVNIMFGRASRPTSRTMSPVPTPEGTKPSTPTAGGGGNGGGMGVDAIGTHTMTTTTTTSSHHPVVHIFAHAGTLPPPTTTTF